MTDFSRNIDENVRLALEVARSNIRQTANKFVWIKFNREGIHAYPEAGTNPDLADVKFLASPHRHIFHFKIGIQVYHLDREIEFIQFKRWIESLYNGSLDLDNKSCEMISDELYEIIATKFPNRNITIEVSEDDENGSYIEYLK